MSVDAIFATSEGQRLLAARDGAPWRRWGPYLSERQWGTVREDYSPDGAAWDYLPHDHARSRAYRWGEDGSPVSPTTGCSGASSLALWNGHDPILKERLFGLTNSEGNHGEDVKELYYFLDGVPTPRLHADALQIPARRLPLRKTGSREPCAFDRRAASANWSIPESSTRVAISTSSSNRLRPRPTTC